MNIKRILWQSVDANQHKERAFWMGGLWVGMTLVIAVFAFVLPGGLPNIAVYLINVARLVCEVFFICNLWMVWKIIRRHKRVIFGECTLSETGCARGHYYFRVKLKTAEGTVETCTKPIYSDTSTYACYQDWKSKRVIVAYDREDNIAIVIGKPTEEWKQLLSSE